MTIPQLQYDFCIKLIKIMRFNLIKPQDIWTKFDILDLKI